MSATANKSVPFVEALNQQDAQDADALATFIDVGLPTKALEAWKQTNLRPVAQQAFALAADGTPAGAWLEAQDASTDTDRIVFINGHFSADASHIGDLPDGVVLAPRSQAQNTTVANLGQRSPGFAGLDALNAAFARDGLVLHVPDNTTLSRPIELIDYANNTSGQAQMAHLRHQIVLGRNTHVQLIERVGGDLASDQLNSAVWTGSLGDNAQLAMSRLGALPDATGMRLQRIDLTLGRDAKATVASADLGGKLVRVDTDVALTAPGSEAHVSGIYFADNGGHIDNHTRIEHRAEHTTSRELFRGVAAGKSKAVFNGMVVVEKGAQKTDSDQQTAALLLSDRAQVASKPELEIYADDVKCAHGNSIGQLDEAALFYLRSRGLDEQTARTVLTFSFLNSVLELMPDTDLRSAAARLVRDRMPGGERLQDAEAFAQ